MLFIGRTPQGVRGLKFVSVVVEHRGQQRRTPQGVRGLKFAEVQEINGGDFVAPRKECVD